MKNYKSVPNRKTFKTKKHEAGTFTSVPNKLLHNPNLSVLAKMLLIQLLSDSDDFTVSPTLYAKRMNVSESSIYNALKELEQKGYVKRKEIKTAIKGLKKEGSNKKIYHYTISEFGNLNNESNQSIPTQATDEVEPNPEVTETPDEINKLLNDYLLNIGDYLEDKQIESLVIDLAKGIRTKNDLDDVIVQIDSEIKKVKKEILAKVENEIMCKNKSAVSESKYREFRDEMKRLIFDSNIIPDWNKLSTKWLMFKKRNGKKKNTDFETQEYDRLEQEWEDLHG